MNFDSEERILHDLQLFTMQFDPNQRQTKLPNSNS